MNDTLLLGHLLDTLNDGVFFKDSRGRFLRINRVLATWYGLLDPAQAIGKSDEDFFPKEFARTLGEVEQAILKNGIPILEQETKVVGRDGKSRWVSTTTVPVRDEQSNVIGILGISRDIRGLKTAEEKNRDSEAIYQSLIESLPQCIFRKDREGRFEYVNQSLCNLLGLKTEHFLGKTDFDMNPKALAAKYRRDDQWVMTHEKVFEGVEYCKTKTKKIKIRVFKSPVYDARGRVIGVQGVFSAMQPAAPAKSARSKGNQ